ncbi:MAG: hypothetical protein AAB787_00085 [Patescibacteria group bacterium]
MYIVIKKFKTEDVEKSIENARNSFLLVVSKMAGFVSYNVLKTEEEMIVSVLKFNSKAEADASTETSSQWVKQNGFDALYQLQEIFSGEVVVEG